MHNVIARLGKLFIRDSNDDEYEPCPECDGSGFYDAFLVCSDCKGKQKVLKLSLISNRLTEIEKILNDIKLNLSNSNREQMKKQLKRVSKRLINL